MRFTREHRSMIDEEMTERAMKGLYALHAYLVFRADRRLTKNDNH